MHCDVYKFVKNEGWYAYIACPSGDDCSNDTDDGVNLTDRLGVLPADLRNRLGCGQFVMHLDLSQKARLAQADIDTVKAKLGEQGYYIQAPPSDVFARQTANKAAQLQDKVWD